MADCLCSTLPSGPGFPSPFLIFNSLPSDGIGHESPEPARRDVNSAGRRHTSVPLLSSALILLAAILSL